VIGLRLADDREVVVKVRPGDPAPSWAACNHAEAGLWPRPCDDDIDLSTAADSEAVLVGFAAALYSTVSPDKLSAVGETDSFLDAYCDAPVVSLSKSEARERLRRAGID
jgi:hypothetical protein